MMGSATSPTVLRARDLSEEAAQWLVLLQHRNFPGAPVFSPFLSTYHDMVDPGVSDERRAAACGRMLRAVLRNAEVERLTREASLAQNRDCDPYGPKSHTTLRGAVLEMIGTFLDEAIQCYASVGIPQSC